MPRTGRRHRNRPPSVNRPLRLEPLEDRCLRAIIVTNLNDAGDGSLRDAIIQANANAGSEVIEFDAAVTGTIRLTSGELTITDDLIIEGPGRDSLSVDAGGLSRVIDINDGDDANRLDVEIFSLTLSGGRANVEGEQGEVNSGGGHSDSREPNTHRYQRRRQ